MCPCFKKEFFTGFNATCVLLTSSLHFPEVCYSLLRQYSKGLKSFPLSDKIVLTCILGDPSLKNLYHKKSWNSYLTKLVRCLI